MKIKVEFSESIKDENMEKIDYQLLIIKILEDDLYFETTIKEIRKKYAIPSQGYKRTIKDTDDVEKRQFFENTNFLDDLFSLGNEYYFPEEWSSSLVFYTLFNVFMIDKVEEIEVMEEKTLYQKVIKHPKEGEANVSVFIKINTGLNFNELTKQIKEEFPKIERFFKINRYCMPIKKIKTKDVNIHKKIYDLRVRRKKSFKFIANQVSEESGRSYSESEIRSKLLKYQKIIKSLKRKE